jgi:Replication protein
MELGKYGMPQKENPQSGSCGRPSDQGSSKFQDRINNLGKRRKDTRKFLYWGRSQDFSNRPDILAVFAKLGQCGNWLVFNNYYTVDQIRLAACYSCDKHLLCSFCAARRGSKYLQRYLERFKIVMQGNPNLKPVMLTLTTVNGDDLEERFEHFMKSLRKLLMKRRDARRGKSCTELEKAVAGIYSVEVTNKGKGWHVHMHAVLLLDDWINREMLSKEWETITRDGSKILHVVRLSKGSEIFDAHGEITPKLVEAFAEVFKYAVKFSDLDHGDRLHAWEIMRGKRLVGSWGDFIGVKVPEGALDDLLEDLPYMQLIYRFSGQAYDLTSIRDFDDQGSPCPSNR